MLKKYYYVFVFLLLTSISIFPQANNSVSDDSTGHLYNLFGNSRFFAQEMGFGRGLNYLDKIYFVGPKGIPIVAKIINNSVGLVYEFTYSDGVNTYVFSEFIATIFYSMGKPVPRMANINGTLLAGLIDTSDGANGDISGQGYTQSKLEEFEKLPCEFKEGLQELYFFNGGDRDTVNPMRGIEAIILPLHTIFKGQHTYFVSFMLNNNSNDINLFWSKFNCNKK
jgi:hypothetical protein